LFNNKTEVASSELRSQIAFLFSPSATKVFPPLREAIRCGVLE